MEGDVLQQNIDTEQSPPVEVKKEDKPTHHKKISAWSVILTVVLAIVLVLLGERIIFDLNKVANPSVDKNYTKAVQSGQTADFGASYARGLSYESSRIANQKVYYSKDTTDKYRTYKLLIHASFIIPIFVLTFLIYYLVNLRLQSQSSKVMVWGYMSFALWMILHLLGETTIYVVKHAEGAAVYIILIILVVIFSFLGYFMQRRHSEGKQSV